MRKVVVHICAEGRLVRRYLPNIMDIGPRFTGPILGMSNMCATGPQPPAKHNPNPRALL